MMTMTFTVNNVIIIDVPYNYLRRVSNTGSQKCRYVTPFVIVGLKYPMFRLLVSSNYLTGCSVSIVSHS